MENLFHDELHRAILARVLRARRAQPSDQVRPPYIFDMETGDPDDVLTLLFLCSKPGLELRAVTVTPGTEDQVSMIGWILKTVGMSGVRIGATEWPRKAAGKGVIYGRFYDSFGRLDKDEIVCEPADRVLLECCDERVTLVTGAALTNLGAALQHDGFRLGRWVAQGGFAGEGVVPSHLQMPKFKGKTSCATWNFGGNLPAATAALASPCIGRRVCVSKNVCHRTGYDAQWQRELGAALANETSIGRSCRLKALEMLHAAMANYMSAGKVKKMHDPLALAVALDESVCELAEVEVFKSPPGSWGSRLAPGSGTWISIDYDDEKFRAVLLSDSLGPQSDRTC